MFSRLLLSVFRLFSRLPFGVIYAISDYVLFPLVYYVVRYRRGLVRRQVADCFPEKSKQECRQVENRFYHFFCDYILETLKMQTMSQAEMRRRVVFTGMDEMVRQLEQSGKQFAFCYLGHYGNWEWMASFPLWFGEPWEGAQIYHPLKNKAMDDFFLHMRSQFRGTCIPMKQTLRQILTDRRQGKHKIIGFIADQGPKWEAVHHWSDFLNHKTAFFTGTEYIARQVDAALLYLRVSRPRRGYYTANVEIITLQPKEMEEFAATERYISLLEAQIRQQPELWLWTHNRWKRSYEKWLQLNKK